MSTTPDDECSFRVRLYCRPKYWVSCFGRIFLNGIVLLFGNLDDTGCFGGIFLNGIVLLFGNLDDTGCFGGIFLNGIVRLFCYLDDTGCFGGIFLNGIVRLFCNMDDTGCFGGIFLNGIVLLFVTWTILNISTWNTPGKFCFFFNSSSLIWIYLLFSARSTKLKMFGRGLPC